MKYEILKDKIVVLDNSQFDIKQICECGQIFTYNKISDNVYEVFSQDKMAKVTNLGDRHTIECDDVAYFENFFDLKTDYNKQKKDLAKTSLLQSAVTFGYGIRILKQDPLETIISFIFSANNHINRIMNSMKKLREFGEKKDGFFAFPTLKQLKQISQKQFKEIGAGYRAAYLVKTIAMLTEEKLEQSVFFDDETLQNFLISLFGVGPKVKDCILLFGYNKSTSFPVDTWIEKVYLDLFKQKVSRIQMSKDLQKEFGSLSGICQQYLFYYKRSGKV